MTALPSVSKARAGTRGLPFVARVVALIAILGVPILGTSYALVSHISTDIRMAKQERADLLAYERVIDLTVALEAVHRDRAEHTTTSRARHDTAVVDRMFAAGERAYSQPGFLPGARRVWQQWHHDWLRTGRPPTVVQLDRILGRVNEIGNDLDDSLVDVDPNFAEQNLAALLLWQVPRAVLALRRTANEITASPSKRLDNVSIESISANRALERQPLYRIRTDLRFALDTEPQLATPLNPILHAANRATERFEHHVDIMLTTFARGPDNAAVTERLAHGAIDAQIALWRQLIVEAERLVARRQTEEEGHRLVAIGVSLLAMLFGTLAITLTGRYMARRDRVELASVKLEGEKLRAELARISVERALHLQEAQFRSVFENADLGIVIYESTGAIAQVNSAARAILGDRMQQFLTERSAQIAPFTNACEPFTCEETHVRDDSATQWLACTFSGVYDEDGACQLVILLLQDATEEKAFQQALLHAAHHDGLTGIANRATFERELSSLVDSAGSPYAVMYIDLDRFKPINDTYGHAAGDHVLVTTAERLRSALASTDTCARIGGDEFAVLVRGRNDRMALGSIAVRVIESIARPIPLGAHLLGVTASVGVALATGEIDAADNLKIAADRALYVAKQAGGNGIRISEPDLAGLTAPR